MSLSILSFASEDEDREGCFRIQWQLPTFTLNCTATDLRFASEIIQLVDETRGNPEFRDIPLGRGRYRHMEPKGIEIGDCFEDLEVSVFKCGECDHGYELRFVGQSEFWLRFHLANEQLDDFLYGLREFIDEHL